MFLQFLFSEIWPHPNKFFANILIFVVKFAIITEDAISRPFLNSSLDIQTMTDLKLYLSIFRDRTCSSRLSHLKKRKIAKWHETLWLLVSLSDVHALFLIQILYSVPIYPVGNANNFDICDIRIKFPLPTIKIRWIYLWLKSGHKS